MPAFTPVQEPHPGICVLCAARAWCNIAVGQRMWRKRVPGCPQCLWRQRAVAAASLPWLRGCQTACSSWTRWLPASSS